MKTKSLRKIREPPDDIIGGFFILKIFKGDKIYV